jgi:hypothetical protein
VEEVNSETNYELFIANKENFILPVDKLATDEDILSLLNNAAKTMKFWNGDVDGIPFELEDLKLMQNNPHHEEGPVYNHVALMLYALRFHGKHLSEKDYAILERAIVWSDIGKAATAKPHESKTWDNGTPWTACNGHAGKSAEMLDEAEGILRPHAQHDWYKPVRWLVAEHMNAHRLSEQIELGKTVIPDFLAPQIEGLEPWDYPEFDDLEIPHEVAFNKRKHYNWIKRNHPLLIIKQKCDEDGRISDLSF